MAKRKANSNPASTNCSPVHQMMNASTDLLQRVIQLGRKQSISADNLHVIGRALTTSDYKSTLQPDGSTLLERVINLGRNEQARSHNQIDRLTSNTLKPPDPYRGGRPSLSCNDLPATDDDDDESESHTSSPRDSPSKDFRPNQGVVNNSSRGWGILKGSANGNKGSGYQAVRTDDHDSKVGPAEDAKDSVTPISCDQIAVVVDTEESDLEMTPGSPDHVRTPLLAKTPPEDVEPQTRTSTSPPCSTKYTEGYEQLSSNDDCNVQKSVISDENEMSSNLASWKRKTNPKMKDYTNATTSASATAGKSLSFENPSYADVTSCDKKTMAEEMPSAAGLLKAAHSESTLQQRPSTLPIYPSNVMNTTSGDVHDDKELCGNPNLQPSDPPHPCSTTVAKSTRLFLF